MSFTMTCGSCGAALVVDEKHIGKTGKCFKRGQRMLIEAPKTEPAPEQELPAEGPKPERPKRRPRPATPRQKEFARDLGIEFDEGINAAEIGKLIDAALAYEDKIDAGEVEPELKTLRKSEPRDMVKSLHSRGKSAIMIHWFDAEARSEEDYEVEISFPDNLSENQVWQKILVLVIELAVKYNTADLHTLFQKVVSSAPADGCR